MKKQTDPFKVKQAEEKFSQAQKQYEIERATVGSKLHEIEKKNKHNANAWLIGYLLSSLESFRQGYNYLSNLEPEMSKQAIKKSKVSGTISLLLSSLASLFTLPGNSGLGRKPSTGNWTSEGNSFGQSEPCISLSIYRR